MLKLSKKIIVSLLIFLQIFLLTSGFGASAAKAASSVGPWWNQNPGQYYLKVHEQGNPSEIFGERYTSAQVDWIIWSVLFWLPTKIVGEEVMNCFFSSDAGTCLGILFSDSSLDTQTESFAYKENTQGMVSLMFEDRSLSAVTYVKNIGRKFHIIPEAQAQLEGFGYGALSPIQGMWRGVRDVSYIFFALVAIAFAFMIMFRVKLSPQTVVTVQSALPKIFIALILVTFSYAIAGLLIDIMYVVIGLISIMFSKMFPIGVSPKFYYSLLTKGQPLNFVDINVGVIIMLLVYPVALLLFLVIIFGFTFGAIGAAIATLSVLGAAGAVVVLALIPGVNIILLIIAGLAILIVAVMMILFIFRIYWMLLKAFAAIVLLTVFAPLQITLGILIPSMGFGRWVKSYVSNLAVFVVTGTLFLLAFMFLFQSMAIMVDQISQMGNVAEGMAEWFFGVNNQISNVFGGTGSVNNWPPLIGGGAQLVPLLFIGVSLVIFFAIPKTADMIKSLISGQPFSYGSAIGEAIGPLTGGARRLGGFATGAVGSGVTGAVGDDISSRIGGAAGAEEETPPITITMDDISDE